MINTADDLAQKPISKLLWQYSLPSIIAMVVNAIYNVVDRIFISNYVGEAAFSGLTVAFPLMLIIFSFANLVGIGGVSLFAIELGKQEIKKANHIFANTLELALIVDIIIVLLGIVFVKPLLIISGGANLEIFNYAQSYFKIILFGFIFQMFSFTLMGFVRTENHPRLAMKTMLVSAITNIVMDFVLIVILDLKVEGAAIATVLGQASGLLLLVFSFYLPKKSVVSWNLAAFKFDYKLMFQIILIGFSAFVSVLGASFSALVLNNFLYQYGGDEAIAAMGAINSLFTFFIMPTDGIVQALQPIIGYNYGARLYERVKKTLKLGLVINIIFATFVFIAYEGFPEFFMGLFLNKESASLTKGIIALRLYMLSIPLLGINMVSVGYFQAIAKAKVAFIIGILRPVVFLIPLVLILPSYFGLNGVWLAQPITDYLAIICAVIPLYLSYKSLGVSTF